MKSLTIFMVTLFSLIWCSVLLCLGIAVGVVSVVLFPIWWLSKKILERCRFL